MTENPTGLEFWRKSDGSLGSAMGGFEYLSPLDLKESQAFLTKVLSRNKKGVSKFPEKFKPINTHRAADVGAGTGRVTQGLLLKTFNQVDLYEPVESFIKTAKSTIKEHNRVRFFNNTVQDFPLTVDTLYDVVWVQWCLMYISDNELIQFLSRVRNYLSPGGIVIVKDNLGRALEENESIYDTDDGSFLRSEGKWYQLFETASYDVLRHEKSLKFPKVEQTSCEDSTRSSTR